MGSLRSSIYVVNATGNLSAFLEKAGLTADHLDSQLADLSERIATPEVDLKDTKFTLGMVNAAKRLDKLSAMVADPAVEVDSEKAQLEILRVNAMLDRLGAKHVTATVGVDVDRRGLGGIGGGAAGGGIGGLLSGATAGLGRAVPGLGGLLSTPQAAIATLVAGLAALPFAATAAAGGVVAALGGGMTAVGVIAAAKNKQVAKSFHDLAQQAGTDLRSISVPFQAVLKDIANQAQAQLPTIMMAFGDAFKAMSRPLDVFGKTLINSLASPSVLRSIRDLGGAFASVLKSLTPMLPSIINQIADGIDGIAQAIRAHPKIFADMINFLGHLVGWSLQAIGALTRVANWLVEFTRDVGHWLNVAWAAFKGFFANLHQSALATENMLAAVWDTIWRNTVTRVRNGISDVIGWFRTLPGRAVAALSGLGHGLAAFASAAFHEMLNAIKNVAGSIWDWLTSWTHRLPGWLRKILHINSPSGVFYDIGKQMMMGLFHGIQDHAKHARNAAMTSVGNIKFSPGAGVLQWGPTVRRALMMEGLNPLLAARVMYQMQTESGGNPNAINLTDINAQRGDPSKGLMQVIGSTFAAYHWPGTSRNIYDPLANVAAALNYARHVYGPSLMSGGMGIGPGHGYDSGGWLPTGLSLAWNNTGRPERVLGPGEGGATYIINVGVLPGGEREAGRRIVGAIRQFEKGSGKGWRS